jgi:tetratricopeptide (TPR) repeat protein
MDAGVINLRGILHARRNELSDARRDFGEAVRLDPALTPGWQNLARACQLEAQQDGSATSCAIDSWQRVLRLRPDDGEAHLSLASLDERAGRFAESLQQIEKLPLQTSSQFSALLLRCADLATLPGEIQKAKKMALRLATAKEFSEADFASVQNAFVSSKAAAVVVTLVEGLDARQAAGLIALRRLAIAYEQLHRPADARKTLERVAMLDPANTAHLLELARLADASGDHEGALGYLAHARDLAPGNPQIHFLFAMIAMEMNLPVQARASLDRALALDPRNPAYDYAMGFVILSTRDAATAANYFQKFVNAKPENVKGHYALGVAYFASGDYTRSKAEMHKVETRPEVAGGVEYFLGCMARREDDMEAASRHLRKSIALMPNFAESRAELARVSMIEGNLPEAEAELNRAVQIDPNSFEGNMQLLVVYRRTKDARADKQAEIVKKLDENRSRRAELMLRMIDARPEAETSGQQEEPSTSR